MAIKMSQADFDLIDAVLDDYDKYGKTDKICPHCGTPIVKETVGTSYSVSCKTPDCLHEICRGI